MITLSKLSNEYELIVITSLGFNPLSLIKILLPITVVLTVTMIITSLGLIPKTKHLTNEMLNFKKKEAKFNIKESEFGQKFGEWLVYITEKKEDEYLDVKLFKTNGKTDQFILSKSAKLSNKEGDLSFLLQEGKSFTITQKELTQIDFQSMKISTDLSNSKLNAFTNPINHWLFLLKYNQDIDNFVFYILISIFPLFSLLLVISFGYFNPRYDDNKAISWAISFILIYYISSYYLSKNILLNALYIVPTIWFFITYVVYTIKIKKFY